MSGVIFVMEEQNNSEESRLFFLRGSPVSKLRRKFTRQKTSLVSDTSFKLKKSKTEGAADKTPVDISEYSSDGQTCLLVDSPFRIHRVRFYMHSLNNWIF